MTKPERNTQIIDRIKAGEKRYTLAMEYEISEKTITRICMAAGLARWQRFKRQQEGLQ